MTDQPGTPDLPPPPAATPPEPTDVERIRDDLFYGFRSYHTPIREQRALVEHLIDAARLEGRASRVDDATNAELQVLLHRLWLGARGSDTHDEPAWDALAALLRRTGFAVELPPVEPGG